MKYNLDRFCQGAGELGIKLDEKQYQQFIIYYDLLVEKNKVMNLTGITEFEEVVSKHFLDSLSLVKAVSLTENCRVIDVGTGAGFPGIPLKIAFPKIKLVLLDSLRKRVGFLNEVIDALELLNVKAIHGRAEDFAHEEEYREKFDLCLSRAVANLAVLSEYCIPFVAEGGYFIPYKAGKAEKEKKEAAKAVKVLGGSLIRDVKFYLPNTDMERNLLVVQKDKKTPNKYPRKAGVPAKLPIK